MRKSFSLEGLDTAAAAAAAMVVAEEVDATAVVDAESTLLRAGDERCQRHGGRAVAPPARPRSRRPAAAWAPKARSWQLCQGRRGPARLHPRW